MQRHSLFPTLGLLPAPTLQVVVDRQPHTFALLAASGLACGRNEQGGRTSSSSVTRRRRRRAAASTRLPQPCNSCVQLTAAGVTSSWARVRVAAANSTSSAAAGSSRAATRRPIALHSIRVARSRGAGGCAMPGSRFSKVLRTIRSGQQPHRQLTESRMNLRKAFHAASASMRRRAARTRAPEFTVRCQSRQRPNAANCSPVNSKLNVLGWQGYLRGTQPRDTSAGGTLAHFQ